MVQRKVADKLGIQADRIKSEKLSATFRPSSHQNHDGKTRGTDLKKKMKRSRPMKLSSFDGSRSAAFKKEVAQPGRPPPCVAPTSAAALQKQSPIKPKGAVPNYMKSTSCSVARKEYSQVISQTTKTGSDTKNLHRRTSGSSKLTPASSGNTSPKNLKRSSSLKLVRTLTKTPSFKPARSSVKRCSKVVLCADMDAQRATCSSTLKDSKFPEYLMLNPGGTEADGTSATKVCPYTYCSLNGHHHARSPPLKCFLSARRRLMKTQKNAKVVPLTPNDEGLDGKPASEEEKIGLEFFVEIYAKTEDEVSSSIGRVDIKEEMVELAGGSKDADITTYEVTADEQKAKYADDEQSDKKLSDVSSHCEDDLKRNLEGYIDESNKMVEGESFCGESVKLLDSCSEDLGMEWDAGEDAVSELDGEEIYSTEEDNLSCSDIEYIAEIEDPTLLKIAAVACQNIDSNWKEISNDQALNEGKHASFDVQMPSLDMEVGGEDDALRGSEPSHVFDYLSYSDDSSIEDEFEDVKNPNGSGQASLEEVLAEVKASFEEAEEENVPGADNVNANMLLNAVSDESNSLDMIGYAPYDQKNNDVSQTSEFDARPGLTEDEEAQVHTDLTTKCSSLDEEILHNDVGERTTEAEDNHDSASVATTMNSDQPSENSCKGDEDTPTHAVDDAEEQEDPRSKRSYQDEYSGGEPPEMEGGKTTEPDSADSILKEDNSTEVKSTRIYSRLKCNPDEETFDSFKNLKGTTRCKRSGEPSEDLRSFNPKEPNYLPLPPDPDAERVDLKHQMMDDRKNSEEWMLDYALRQTVTKLAPARKRKVALLVEAFEKVMPTSKYETHLQSTSASFPHARPIQACS
ncbi:calmodulin binding protein PICBP [Rhodamnia argentea]|uniref:Calmodulin binding protein PICBP n=1 Tax=Rhodamnia argentea TaxID=178133 RepID=A0A8B8PC43_9MYRT|nr:calmodulin binding protein PICBP [Rhodamnia argentea]